MQAIFRNIKLEFLEIKIRMLIDILSLPAKFATDNPFQAVIRGWLQVKKINLVALQK